MNLFLAVAFIAVFTLRCDACANHSPPLVPNSFLGTVEQGCTPGAISSVTDLRTDPGKCNLPLASGGCNLCNLRLYLPESTSSRFLVQPLHGDFSTAEAKHIEATKCKCSDGCYFHQSSITTFGGFDLPNGLTTTGMFSEPFACYSGISMGDNSNPQFTFLIWCETDGGCPNPVVARYSFLIRFELSSPNRPPVKSIFTAKITSLPASKCLVDVFDEDTKKFVQDGSGIGGTGAPSTTKAVMRRAGECKFCRKNKNCRSNICHQNKCIRARSAAAKSRCGIGASKCAVAERVNRCVTECLASA